MDSGSKELPNRRAQKSLGFLCSNFLYLYNTEGVETIELDDASARLGVERRRIYDIVNILECVGILARDAKNKYIWKGFEAIPKALDNLKEEGLTNVRENSSGTSRSEKVSDDEEKACSDVNLRQKSSAPSKVWKENCLGLLTRNFIKLFLCTDMETISLDDAAKLLLGDVKHTSMTNKTTVRRLYDIANVLSSLNIVEKIHRPHTKKSAFKWLGVASTSHNETDDDHRNEACNDKTREGIDCKSLASTSRPQYQTQALKDLFSHFVEAWKLWRDEVVG